MTKSQFITDDELRARGVPELEIDKLNHKVETAPPHPEHVAPVRKMGRPVRDGEFMHVVGNFSGVQQAREAMGIKWMVRDELREAIPPAYTEFIGRAALEFMGAMRLAAE